MEFLESIVMIIFITAFSVGVTGAFLAGVYTVFKYFVGW